MVTQRCEYLTPLNYTLTNKWLKGSIVYYVLPFRNEISPTQAASRTQPGRASPEGSTLRSEQTSPQGEVGAGMAVLDCMEHVGDTLRGLVSRGRVACKYLKATFQGPSSIAHPAQALGLHPQNTLVPASGPSAQEATEFPMDARRALSA